jgi:hypothetical protein
MDPEQMMAPLYPEEEILAQRFRPRTDLNGRRKDILILPASLGRHGLEIFQAWECDDRILPVTPLFFKITT